MMVSTSNKTHHFDGLVQDGSNSIAKVTYTIINAVWRDRSELQIR